MTKLFVNNNRGSRLEITSSEVRATIVDGKRELLPSDPHEVVKILKQRRNKPGAKAKAKMAAALNARGL